MTISMPRVVQRPTSNYSPTPIKHDLLIAHMMEGGYAGSVVWLCQRQAAASAHLCMSEDGAEVSQLVPLSMKAWAQCKFNGRGISLEIPGFTAEGVDDDRLRSAAVIFGWLARAYAIPVAWAQAGQGRGICSHHDLGGPGGGHVDICGVGDATWRKFMNTVQFYFDAFGDEPLPTLALHGAPNPHQVELPPDAPPTSSHGGAARDEADDAVAHPTFSGFPHGSVADLQWRLNKAGAAALKVDGYAGRLTRRAICHFQSQRKLSVDGQLGPETWLALDAATS